jgi:hypothetical protein
MDTRLVQTREVNYQDESMTVRLVVRPANTQIGMLRTLLIDTARQEERARGELQEGDLNELSRRILHTIVYPALIAATIEHEGFETWPLPFDQFIELPEPLEAAWEEAAYALNPHWRMVDPDKEKKA